MIFLHKKKTNIIIHSETKSYQINDENVGLNIVPKKVE